MTGCGGCNLGQCGGLSPGVGHGRIRGSAATDKELNATVPCSGLTSDINTIYMHSIGGICTSLVASLALGKPFSLSPYLVRPPHTPASQV